MKFNEEENELIPIGKDYVNLTEEEIEEIEQKMWSTLFLCGEIGLKEHIYMSIVKSIAKNTSFTEKEIIEMGRYKFIPHCEHVKEWLSQL